MTDETAKPKPAAAPDQPSLRGDAVKVRDSINTAVRSVDNFFRHGIEAQVVPAAAKAVAACKRGLVILEDKIKDRMNRP